MGISCCPSSAPDATATAVRPAPATRTRTTGPHPVVVTARPVGRCTGLHHPVR